MDLISVAITVSFERYDIKIERKYFIVNLQP
jgi:hypothetical protein